MPLSSKAKHTFIVIGAIAGWFAVVFQFILMMINREAGIPETVIRFFSFFTILTNIIVSLCYTGLLMKPGTRMNTYFSNPKVIAAIAVYITVVGLVYNIVLRYMWDPTGLQLVVDELLHSFNPVWFVLFWFLFVDKSELRWKSLIRWLLYPLIYVLYVFGRGALSGNYPYPFLDVPELGYPTAILNAFFVTLVFVFFSAVYVGIGKMMSRK
ncbi:MAG TPA: Pr6Pr family membrane protein [Ignavibacteria bacterium]|nr:Pr6Pr family membrane protein [Ignavibacteria bacterium]